MAHVDPSLAQPVSHESPAAARIQWCGGGGGAGGAGGGGSGLGGGVGHDVVNSEHGFGSTLLFSTTVSII
jgi:hypothetical protein